MQKALFEYAKSKNDYQGRYDALKELYKGVEGADIDAELTADLVGDYLFTDSDFVNNLSVTNRNVFQKIYDEIKHLMKLVTAGSKEARQLEKVKRTFDKAYRENAKGNTETEANQASAKEGNIKYSLSTNAKTDLHKALYDTKYSSEVRLRDESPAIMVSQKGVKNLPMAMNASHIRENVFTEDEARKLGLRVDKHTHYHGLGEDFFLQIIDGLDHVKEAYRGTKNASDPSRRENYFLLVSEFKDKHGNIINVPVYINEHAQFNRVFVDVNKISTVLGRDSFRDYIGRQIKNNNLIRIKNKSIQTSEPNALIARGYEMDASNNSIPQNSEKSSDFAKNSLSFAGEAPVRNGTPLNDLRLDAPMQEDIGPVREDIFPNGNNRSKQLRIDLVFRSIRAVYLSVYFYKTFD